MSARIPTIIQRYFLHNQSSKVKKVFASWIIRDVNKEEKDKALTDIWDSLDIASNPSTKKSFDKLLSTIHSTKTKKRNTTFIRRLSRIAAIIILPIVSAAITYSLMKSNEDIDNYIQLVECIVPYGETRTITLPDSSIVKVNSGSILIYPEHFTCDRNVFLNGEAYFTVQKDEIRAFIVKTTDMDIEVLGTVFNVNAYTDSNETATTLESGRVNVRLKNINQDQITLSPDECIRYDRSTGQYKKSVVKVENETAWIKGNMVIQGMTIHEIIKFIERKYAMKVYLNSNKYDKERITMKVKQDEDIYAFMHVLKYLVPQLKYKIENDNLYIY